MTIRESSIRQAAEALRAGLPAVFPTDTVYGLGLSVLHAHSPQQLYRIKGRQSQKPIAWLVGGPEALGTYGQDIPAYAHVLAQAYWPGALTLIVKACSAVPAAFQSAQGSIGVRMPDSRTALDLIGQVGCPLATTSANLSGRPAVGSADQLDAALLERVGMAVYDDSPKSGTSSTVVDCTGDFPVVLRVGSITEEEVMACARRQQ